MKIDKQLKKSMIVLFTVLGMAALFFTGCKDKEKEMAEEETVKEESAENGEEEVKMPAFTAKDLKGNTVTEAVFGEKDLTVVNVWGTFCPPCIGEMPQLGEWARSMPDNVQIIGLIIDIEGDEDTEHHDLAVEITEKADADFLQIIANADFSEILNSVYGVPTTFFVDGNGCIVGKAIVGADVEGYKNFVEEYLNEQ